MATPMALTSDAGFMMSDGLSRSAMAHRQRPPSSSAGRPRAPPSESMGAPSDDEGEGFEDDAIPGRTRPTDQANIPRVEDKIGLLIQEHFENFIEGFIETPTSSGAPTSSAITTDKYYVAQIHGMRTYQLSTFYVDYKHLQTWSNGNLADAIVKQYYRFLPFLTAALHSMIAKYEPQYFREHRQPTASSNQTTSAPATWGRPHRATLPAVARRQTNKRTSYSPSPSITFRSSRVCGHCEPRTLASCCPSVAR